MYRLTTGRIAAVAAMAAFLSFGATPATAWAQSPEAGADGKALTIEEYATWRTVRSVSISDDGRWVSYAYAQREVDDSLFVRNVDTGQQHVVVGASGPEFSDNGRWIAYFVSPPVDEVSRLEEAGDPVRRAVEVRNLASGDAWRWDNAASFSFAPGGGAIAVRKVRADGDADHDGSELIVRYLDLGFEELIGSVSSFAFDEPGAWLAYTVDATDRDGNGLYLLSLETRVRTALDNADAHYSRLTWAEEGTALAALRGVDHDDYLERENVLLAFSELSEEGARRHVFDPATRLANDSNDGPAEAGWDDRMIVSEKANLQFSEGGTSLFFGARQQQVAPSLLCVDEADEEVDEKEDESEGSWSPAMSAARAAASSDPVLSDPLICSDTRVSNVDIWHWADERIQSVQESQVNADRNRTLRAVFHLDTGETLQLADDAMRSIDVTDDGRWAIGVDRTPYVSDWKPNYGDHYRVDTRTGAKTPMLEQHERTLGLSPDSEHMLYWKDGHIWSYAIEADQHTNLTASAPVSFVNAEDDHTGEKPPYGVAGWTDDGSSVVLNHRYDLYLQPLDGGAATNLTGGFGDANEIRLRFIRTDPDAETIDLEQPQLLSAFGQWTKQAGFFRFEGGDLEKLVLDDASFSTPLKARNADRVLITRQTFRVFPDYHLTDTSFGDLQRITDANPQQSEYRWGDRILFDYTNNDGVRLQGTLAIPDGYREGEKLPMLVHFYEKLSQNLHRYPSPRYASSPQYSGYVSNGYLVMEPDVHFRTRTSHSDMVESLEAAVQAVIDMGYVDPDAVVLHGHSYSGGGSSYIATQSDMFAAITSGAAPINLRSEFNQIWPGGGANNHRYDIYGQGRYGTDPYTDLELYLDQSPITHAPTMDTPLLYLHGVEDGTVPWIQGLEWYNGLRFNEKNVIWLSYPGEGHGLRRFENQKDFQVRMRQFFDHYAKGTSAPAWMTDGRSFIEKRRALGTNGNGGRGR